MLSSQSTNDEVFAAFDDNAGYEQSGSLSQALEFQTACRILLRRLPSSIGTDGQTVSLNTSFLQSELERVQRWIASYRAGGGVKYADLSDCRE